MDNEPMKKHTLIVIRKMLIKTIMRKVGGGRRGIEIYWRG
jgi:hypothetical protein